MGQIYRHTCPEGKAYVGQTRYTWQERAGTIPARSYSSRFRSAIVRFGWDSFSHEVLEEGAFSFSELLQRESFWIKELKSYLPEFGYNTAPGSVVLDEISEQVKFEIISFYETNSLRETEEKFAISSGIISEILRGYNVPPHPNGFHSPERALRRKAKQIELSKTIRICPVCDEPFIPEKYRQTICSKSCNGLLGAEKSKGSLRGVPKTALTGNANAKGNRGGKITSHNRWHVARSILKQDCELCFPENASL